MRSRRPATRGHLGGIRGQHDAVRAQAAGIGLLALGAREEGHLGAQGLGQLQAHVAQAAEADDGHLAARAHLPVPQGRPGGDAGAEQGRGALKIQGCRHLQHEAVGHHDLVRVAALGGPAIVAVRAAIGAGEAVLAVLLLAMLAGLAVAAGIDQAAHADRVTGLEAGHAGAHRAHAADDLVAGDDRVRASSPSRSGPCAGPSGRRRSTGCRSPHRRAGGRGARRGRAPGAEVGDWAA